MNATRNESGYTLLELLAYTWILAIIVNGSAALFLSAKCLDALGKIALTRMDALAAVERDLRNAALDAAVLETEFPRIIAGADDAFALRSVHTGAPRLYVWQRDESALYYIEYAWVEDEFRLNRSKKYELVAVSLSVQELTPSLLRVELQIDNRDTPNTIPATNVFLIALRSR